MLSQVGGRSKVGLFFLSVFVSKLASVLAPARWPWQRQPGQGGLLTCQSEHTYTKDSGRKDKERTTVGSAARQNPKANRCACSATQLQYVSNTKENAKATRNPQAVTLRRKRNHAVAYQPPNGITPDLHSCIHGPSHDTCHMFLHYISK